MILQNLKQQIDTERDGQLQLNGNRLQKILIMYIRRMIILILQNSVNLGVNF